MTCGWQTILCRYSQLGDPSGNSQLYDSSLWKVHDSSLWEILFYENSMNISFSYILFSPWPISEYILDLPEQRKSFQSHELNDISSLFALTHCSSQDWILFTNNESLYMLSAYCKPGQDLKEILMTTLGVNYNHLHYKNGKTETDSKPFFDATGQTSKIVQLVFY